LKHDSGNTKGARGTFVCLLSLFAMVGVFVTPRLASASVIQNGTVRTDCVAGDNVLTALANAEHIKVRNITNKLSTAGDGVFSGTKKIPPRLVCNVTLQPSTGESASMTYSLSVPSTSVYASACQPLNAVSFYNDRSDTSAAKQLMARTKTTSLDQCDYQQLIGVRSNSTVAWDVWLSSPPSGSLGLFGPLDQFAIRWLHSIGFNGHLPA